MVTLHFNGTQPLRGVFPVSNALFLQLGGVKSKHNYYDSFKRLVGYLVLDDASDPLPVTRKIYYKKNPPLHKCDARCRNAKGHDCECSCGGQFHGAGS